MNVAIAVSCLNGLRISYSNTTLKCSFGTSKYCLNFLKENKCDQSEKQCPFLHYIERRRDKVIQDDYEFKDFIAQQDKICQEFMTALNLYTIGSKVDFYHCGERDSVN